MIGKITEVYAMQRSEATLKSRVNAVAINHPARPFLAEISGNGAQPILKVHTSKAVSAAAARRDLRTRLREACGDAAIEIEAHGDRALRRRNSLEAFAGGQGEVVFDPTGAIARARALTAYARALRERFGMKLTGVFWSGEWRTVYVMFDAGRVVVDKKIKVGFLREAETAARELLRSACGTATAEFVAAIRLGIEAPPVPVIPIDAVSARLNLSGMRALGRRASLSAAAALTSLGLAGGANAADIGGGTPTTDYGPAYTDVGSGPAVSGLNGKIAIMGGVMNRDAIADESFGVLQGEQTVVIGEGSVSLPLGHSFGAQFDAAFGVDDDEHQMWGVGGHLFWRDPSKGLLGVIASYSEIEEFFDQGGGLGIATTTRDMSRVGAEAELYMDQFTIAALAGYQWVEAQASGDDDGLFAKLDFSWYATDNLALSVGGEYSEGPGGAVTAGVEFQPFMNGLSGLTLFADGAYGNEDYYRALGGVRFYFGQSKSLKARHREDDPQNNLATGSFGGLQQQYLE
jgi:hypothetical protein